MTDERAYALILTLVPLGVALLLAHLLTLGVLCLVVAGMIATVLWTPMRAWLGIPPAAHGAGKIGYRGRRGSTGRFNRSRFGEGLDTAIDNEGDIEVDDSDIG
jgi:hypothetical protein